MAIAGRCECGVVLELAQGDEHLACRGLRRCRECAEVKALADGFRKHRRVCRACQAAYHLDYIRLRMLTDEGYRESHREASRLWGKNAYRSKPGYAERMKEKNRRRYRTDPAFAEAKRESFRARWRAQRGEAA